MKEQIYRNKSRFRTLDIKSTKTNQTSVAVALQTYRDKFLAEQKNVDYISNSNSIQKKRGKREIMQFKYPTAGATPEFYHNRAVQHPEYPLFVALMESLGIPDGIIDFAWTRLLEGFYLQDQIQHQLEQLEFGEGIVLDDTTRNVIRNDNVYFEEVAIVLSDYLSIGGQDLALWSGGIDLSDYAFGRGYCPLERTILGSVVNQIEFHNQWILQAPLWNILSTVFVRQQPAGVHVFLRTFEADAVLFRQEVPIIREIFPGIPIRWHAIYTSPNNIMWEIDHQLALVAIDAGFPSEDMCVSALMEYYSNNPNPNTQRGLNTLLDNIDPESMPGVY